MILLTTSCDEVAAPLENEVPVALTPNLVTLYWQHPFPQGNDLNRMWGFSDGSFYAVGDAGTVVHFDGVAWTVMDTPMREDLHGIWASGPSDVFAAGFDGTLVHYDGTRWTEIPVPTNRDLYAVSVNPPDELFVTGLGGSVWNRREGSWVEHAVAPGRRLRALLSYSHEEVYVAGSDESLLRFDGSSWTDIDIPINLSGDSEFRDIWGPGPGMFACVVGPALIWSDGVTWGALAGFRDAYGVWGFSFDNQVVMEAEVSRHLVDGATETYATSTGEPLYDVWGTSTSNYYAVGRSGTIEHFDGSGWQARSRGTTSDLRDVCVEPASALAVGADGTVLRQDGTPWVAENVDPGYDLWGAWMGGGLAVAVGRYTPNERDWRSAILMNNGSSWTDASPVGDSQRLFDVWGSASNDVYAVGWGGEILHYDGLAWSAVVPAGGDVAMLRSVSGTSPTNVIAVGRTNDLRGLIMTYDGLAWNSRTHTGSEELYGVWIDGLADAFAVGSFGVILRLDGDTWTKMKSPTSEALFCVWGSSSSDVYAAGWEGTLVHYDGSSWRELLPPTSRSINSIAGLPAQDEILFAGDRGSILSSEDRR